MGQGEVMKVLEERECLTEKEIAEILDVTISSVWNCLNKLIKYDEVVRKEKVPGNKRHGYVFMINLKLK